MQSPPPPPLAQAHSRVFHDEKNYLYLSIMGLTKLVYLPPEESKFTGVTLIGKTMHRFLPRGTLLNKVIDKWESTYCVKAFQ